MLNRLRTWVFRAATGRRLGRAIERNERAADELDTLLRKVLRG
jgi:hypothetical protein